MALPSLEFGDVSVHDMDGNWMSQLIYQLYRMARECN
jgi:hypothetical protein